LNRGLPPCEDGTLTAELTAPVRPIEYGEWESKSRNFCSEKQVLKCLE
jgi:hypothetical protein